MPLFNHSANLRSEYTVPTMLCFYIAGFLCKLLAGPTLNMGALIVGLIEKDGEVIMQALRGAFEGFRQSAI